MGIPVRGVALPVENDIRWYPVVRPKQDSVLRVTVLDETYMGFQVHFDERSLPCDESEHCGYCRRGVPFQYEAYAAVFVQHAFSPWLLKAGRAVLGISEGMARGFLPILEEHGSLRGLQIEVRKKYPKKVSSPYVVKQVGNPHPEGLCEPHEIMPSLRRMWGINADWFQKRILARDEVAPGGVRGKRPRPVSQDEQEERAGDAPTAEQRERFRQIFKGFGNMPS